MCINGFKCFRSRWEAKQDAILLDTSGSVRGPSNNLLFVVKASFNADSLVFPTALTSGGFQFHLSQTLIGRCHDGNARLVCSFQRQFWIDEDGLTRFNRQHCSA